MKTAQNDGQAHQNQCQSYNSDTHPLTDSCLCNLCIIPTSYEYPYALANAAHMEEDKRAEKNNEKFVIFSPNAVIQIFAVMIEFFSASIASFAVVTSLLPVADTYLTVLAIIISEGQIRIENIIVDGVFDCYDDIDDNNESQYNIMKYEEYP